MNNKKNIIRIIAIVALLLIVLSMVVMMTACGNMQVIDTTYTFDRAIIALPNGEIVEGSVDSWGDCENSDQLQVVIDGKTYLAHSSNVVLIAE